MAWQRGSDRVEVAVLVSCLLASIFLFAFARTEAGRVVAQIEMALLWPADAVRAFVEGVVSERGENERLKAEIAILRTREIQLQRALGDSAAQRRNRAFLVAGTEALTAARVLGTAGEPWPLLYHLSVGERDGIRKGQPVLAPEGLVGRVEVTDGRTSSAALITDPLLAVASEVVPGGARGVVRFVIRGRPGLYLQHVPLTDTVRVGDQVATSGMSSRFPPGIPVGTVKRVGRDPGGLVQEIELEPSAPLGKLREVFVFTDTTSRELALWQREDDE